MLPLFNLSEGRRETDRQTDIITFCQGYNDKQTHRQTNLLPLRLLEAALVYLQLRPELGHLVPQLQVDQSEAVTGSNVGHAFFCDDGGTLGARSWLRMRTNR